MLDLQYKVGEHVVYGNDGVCVIADITQPQFMEQTPNPGAYYILKPLNNSGSTFYVPVDNETLRAKMRYVLSHEEIDTLLEGIRGKEISWIDDKKQRAETFRGILRRGIRDEMLLMLRCIYLQRSKLTTLGKKLPTADEGVLQSAEKQVREEFSYVLAITPEQVGEYIRSALDVTS